MHFKLNKYSILVLSFLLFWQNGRGQAKTNTIIITADTNKNANYKETKINLFQGNLITKGSLFDKIVVYAGVEFQIEFENKLIQVPGYKKIKIYSDTVIALDIKLLQELVVRSKKKIISETLSGFAYYPQNDSIYKDKSILLALQRLPFVTVEDDHSLPKYKADTRILFLINGKQRKGLENNWVDVLKAIKAKDIYKVELLEDIPAIYSNQGYNSVINIHTLDANIYGTSLNAAVILDQRKNVKTNAGFTYLRKKSDLSLRGSLAGDNKIGQINTQIFKKDILTIDNAIATTDKEKSFAYSLDFGNRIDSANDFAVNLKYSGFEYATIYSNLYSFPYTINNIQNKSNRSFAGINTSIVHRVNKFITTNFTFAANLFLDKSQRRVSFLNPLLYDSINNQTTPKEFNWIAEYNIQDNKKIDYQKEAGIQVYNKRVEQNFEQYSIDPYSNANAQLLYSSSDTLFVKQLSIRPYYRFGKNISATKRLSMVFASELFCVKNRNQSNVFLLPSIRLTYKKIFKNQFSLRNIATLSFGKPGTNFLYPIQINTPSLQKQIGNTNLKPSKNFSNSIEFVKTKKATFSYTISVYYSFDNINFFTKYDPATNQLVSVANNGSVFKSIGNDLFYQMPNKGKISLWVSGSIDYSIAKNKEFGTKYSGVRLSGQHALNYAISRKYGTVGFISFLNSNQNNAQGFYRGTVRYSINYGTNVFNKHFALSLSAENFLLKNRKVLTYTFDEVYSSYTNRISPYRLVSIRLSCNFSNLKAAKYAARKTTEITGEVSGEK